MSIHFPGESADYRRQRDELLNAEIQLRKHSKPWRRCAGHFPRADAFRRITY